MHLREKSLTIETAKVLITPGAICVWQHFLKIAAIEHDEKAAVPNIKESAIVKTKENGRHLYAAMECINI